MFRLRRYAVMKQLEVIKFIKKIPFVRLVYIFGSTTKGAEGPQDIDVAVLLNGRVGVEKKMDFQFEFGQLLEKIFGRRADVVVMNDASPFLKYQILKYGELVYEREEGEDSALRFDVMTEYFDLQPLLNFFYSNLKRRTRRG